MEKGYVLEMAARYDDAIRMYRVALSDMHGVYPDVIVKAKIAAHNRMGACDRKKGDDTAALREFRMSADLGDIKYAPKQVKTLEARLLPGSGR